MYVGFGWKLLHTSFLSDECFFPASDKIKIAFIFLQIQFLPQNISLCEDKEKLASLSDRSQIFGRKFTDVNVEQFELHTPKWLPISIRL